MKNIQQGRTASLRCVKALKSLAKKERILPIHIEIRTNCNYPLTQPPLATHKDKRDRESVWASLMKPRDRGARGDPKGGRKGEQTTRVNNELNKTIM